jgi:SAM-dependent methyltransferase
VTKPADIPGAIVPVRPGVSPEGFDAGYAPEAQAEILQRMAREAYGDDYPDGVEPWGMTTLWTLGTFVRGLGLHEGDELVDLACGRGGVGLWIARATGSKLTGVDWSPVGIAGATARSSQWVPDGRAHFQVGDLAATGLPDESADAVVCADAIFFALDRIAVVREVHRILRPGGRFAFSADESVDGRPSAVPDWRPIIEAGGLAVVERIEIPMWREQLGRMYKIWLDNLDEVAEAINESAANELRDEAQAVGPTLAGRTGVLYVARRA